MITSITINGTFYNLDVEISGVFVSTEKIVGQPRKMEVFDLKKLTWRKTMLLPLNDEDVKVLEKVILAVQFL